MLDRPMRFRVGVSLNLNSCAGTCIFSTVFTAVLFGASITSAAEPQGKVDFNRDIRPLISKSCFNCHGPDEGHRKAGLRLDRRDDALIELETGSRAIVPGKPAESELYLRITSTDDGDRMPPKGSGHELSAEQIATIGRWIEQGAPYARHWSFVKPERPAEPKVAQSNWARNSIDRFILAHQEAAGLKPSAEADRYTLIRRLSLDLRGLPPTPKEVQAFVHDSSPEAYEKVVDAFLADPAYGERWARMWLDLARYADSKGLGSDPLRTIWRYRDWVIDAFNRNLPFDQFTTEQLAGDLLPDPTLDQKIATAFHRNTMTNTEGGTDDEEFRVAAVKDRVDTTFQVWMGLTMGCAKCHSHKFDPLTQAEYYQSFAFFNQSADNDQGDESPTIPAPNREVESRMREIESEIAKVRTQLDTPTDALAAAQKTWEESLRVQAGWTPLDVEGLTSEGKATLVRRDDGSIFVSGENPAQDVYTLTAKISIKGITAFRLESIPDADLPSKGAGRNPDGNFVLSRFSASVSGADQSSAPPKGRFVRIELPGKSKILSLAEVQVFQGNENVARKGKATQSSVDFGGPPELAIDGNTDGDFHGARSTTHNREENDPWWEVDLLEPRSIERIAVWNRTDGDIGGRLNGFRIIVLDAERKAVWREEIATAPKTSADYQPGGPQEVKFSQALADFSQSNFPVANALKQADLAKSGWAVGPHVAQPHSAYFIAAAKTPEFPTTQVTIRLEHRFQTPQYTLGRFRISVTDSPEVLRRLSVPAEVLAVVDLPVEQRSAEQSAKVASHFRSIAPELAPLREKIAALEKSRPEIPTVPVMVELPTDRRRATKIMIKGNFLTTGEPVEAKVPAAFHPLPADAPSNRLGLAAWVISRENPFTARVMVNRFWSQLFGTGLVETEEDFGTQGDLPSHPDLLDWLAVEFMEPSSAGPKPVTGDGRWDMKRLLKLIVMSATYRQTSQVTPDRLEKDPRNRLLTRGARFRLEAEMVRDQALALSGLLSRKSHGPSVYPPQPPGLWQAAFNGERTWTTSTGEDKHRRALYTLWRRTVPYPSMAAFDAPSRELCTVRRIRTNTPLQAFVTLNDPVYVEAAQALARRIYSEGGTTTVERVRYGLQLCQARPATSAQAEQLVFLYEAELADYQSDAASALLLATDPLGPLPEGMPAAELAAWTVVANILLNLDGVLMKN